MQMLLKCEIWLKKLPVLEFNTLRTGDADLRF